MNVSMLFSICWRSVGQPTLLAVPEVTVRSVAPIFAGFAFAVLRVKRTVNPSEEAGGSQHYPRESLSCPREHVRPSLWVLSVVLPKLVGATKQ